jgi:hypothetical protein
MLSRPERTANLFTPLLLPPSPVRLAIIAKSSQFGTEGSAMPNELTFHLCATERVGSGSCCTSWTAGHDAAATVAR